MDNKAKWFLNEKGFPTLHIYLSRGIPIKAIAPDVMMEKPSLSQFKSHWWDVPSADDIQREAGRKLQYEKR